MNILRAKILAPALLLQVSLLRGEAPNIVLIFTDDLGLNDIGAYTWPSKANAWPAAGPNPIKPSAYLPLPDPNAAKNLTPRIDSLAEAGLKMTSFYSASPVCSPSRAALLTGSHGTRVGFEKVVLPEPFSDNVFGLHPGEVTLAERLRERGYRTGLSGKWHLGDGPDFHPRRHGFDEFFGLPHSNDIWTLHPSQSWPPLQLLHNEAPLAGTWTTASGGTIGSPIDSVAEQRHLLEAFTEHALQFMETSVAEQRPFFLFFSTHAPHTPCYPHPAFTGASGAGSYYDVIAELDHRVGQILDKLEALGIADNTLVVFSSDNGPWHQRNDPTRPEQAVGSAYPHRGAKRDDLEGGLRMPLLARFPGRIPAGRVTDGLGSLMDLMPTFLSLAGGTMPTDRVTDGVDLWPLWSDTGPSPRQEFQYYKVGETEASGIRVGAWKRLGNALYNLDTDPQELTNLASQQPALYQDLGARRTQWNNAMVRRPKGLPASNQIDVEHDRVRIARGGEAVFRVRLVQPATATVTAARFSGNPHLSLEGASSLEFTPENHGEWQEFRVRAQPGAEERVDGATFRLEGGGLHLREVLLELEPLAASPARQAYEDWASGVPEGQDPAPGALRDGWPNLLRFALDVAPDDPAPQALAPELIRKTELGQHILGLRFRVREGTESSHPLLFHDMQYEVMATTSLETWPEGSPGYQFEVLSSTPPGTLDVYARPSQPQERSFLRLRVTLPE